MSNEGFVYDIYSDAVNLLSSLVTCCGCQQHPRPTIGGASSMAKVGHHPYGNANLERETSSNLGVKRHAKKGANSCETGGATKKVQKMASGPARIASMSSSKRSTIV